MIIPTEADTERLCAAAQKTFVTITGFPHNDGANAPLLLPNVTLTPKSLDWFWIKFTAETSTAGLLFIDHLPKPMLLLSEEMHFNLLKQYPASALRIMETSLVLDGFLHVPTSMPRWNFIAGAWVEALPNTPNHFTAQYEDALICTEQAQWKIRTCRVSRIMLDT